MNKFLILASFLSLSICINAYFLSPEIFDQPPGNLRFFFSMSENALLICFLYKLDKKLLENKALKFTILSQQNTRF